ncbi:MAG: COX15/CtaA family protein [Polyangiales bacterium]
MTTVAPATWPSAKAAHRLAIGAAASTWLLLLVGGMVHGTGSSLACPDWPTCYGTFFPEMKGGVFYEHGHRVFAFLIGVLTLCLAFVLFRRRNADPGGKTTAKLGYLAVFLVCMQGTLGGITVLFKLPLLVTLAHLTTSMCFFSLMAWVAIRTAPPRSTGTRSEALARLRPVAGAAALATLGQIVFGGVVRHTHNGLACWSIPLCDGRALADQAWPAALGKQLQMGHRYFAVALAALVIGLAVATWRRAADEPRTRLLAVLAVALVVVQIALGLVSVADSLPLIPVTAHLGVAALILLVHVSLFATLPPAVRAPSALTHDAPHAAAFAGGE